MDWMVSTRSWREGHGSNWLEGCPDSYDEYIILVKRTYSDTLQHNVMIKFEEMIKNPVSLQNKMGTHYKNSVMGDFRQRFERRIQGHAGGLQGAQKVDLPVGQEATTPSKLTPKKCTSEAEHGPNQAAPNGGLGHLQEFGHDFPHEREQRQ